MLAIFLKERFLPGKINMTEMSRLKTWNDHNLHLIIKKSLKQFCISNIFICRLRLEALSDKDPGVLDTDSENEDSSGAQSLNPGTTSGTAATESNLPNSQDPAGELSASQPQPTSTEALLDEEDLLIEEYDSD